MGALVYTLRAVVYTDCVAIFPRTAANCKSQIMKTNKALWNDMSSLKIISNEKAKCRKQFL